MAHVVPRTPFHIFMYFHSFKLQACAEKITIFLVNCNDTGGTRFRIFVYFHFKIASLWYHFYPG